MRSFRKNLLQAATEERNAGNISRWQMMQLRVATLRPQVMEQLEELATQEAVIYGATKSSQEIDWDSLLDFLKEILPLLLEFIMALLNIFTGPGD